MAALSELEWLALLPARPPVEPPLPWASARPPPDPAEKARRADPLTAARLLSLLSSAPSQALRRVEQVRLFVGATHAAAGPISFTGRDLAVATVAYAFQTLAWWGSVAYTGLLSRRQTAKYVGNGAEGKDAAEGVAGSQSTKNATEDGQEDVGGDPAVLDASELAQKARWLQLASASNPDGPLLAHDPRDPQCPCIRQGCLGREPARAASLTVLTAVFWGLFCIASYNFLTGYTAFVTLAGYTWHTAWSASVAAFFLLSAVSFNFLAPIYARLTPSLALIAIEARLQHRAFSLALATLVDRLDAALVGPADDLHPTLLRALAPVLRLRFTTYLTARNTSLIAVFIEVVTSLIYIAGSGCLPAYTFLPLLCFILLALIDLVHVARANAHVDSISSLHFAARSHVRSLLLRLGPRSPALRDELLDRERELGSALDGAERLKATFAGVPVTMGVVRTVAATVLTVGVGLFGILRGLGVYVTADNVCGGFRS
ncbi:hypothetical protein DFJ74DRAFT_713776 [Hyaloraphidium curvatum]|nr:hypothetical protein DFJ74DRAFT_713776 [Hyaloraphidium curvatum]